MPKATYTMVLAEPAFRAMFGTRTLGIAAETLRILALSLLVYEQSGSPLLGALAFGAGFVPQAIGGLFLGAVADRIPARPLLVCGYGVEALVALVLAFGGLPAGASLLLVAAVACLTPVVSGAGGRLVAGVLSGDAYVLGRSLLGMASSGAQLLGLAVGGLTSAALGPRHALLVSAAVHVVAALWARLGLPRQTRTRADSGAVRASWTGSRRILGDRATLRLLLAQWLPCAFVTGGEALLVPYASTRGFPAGWAAGLLAAVPVGMLLGDLLVGRLARPSTRERLVPWLVVLLGAPLIAVAAGPPLPVVIGLLVLAGGGFSYGLGLQRAFLEAVPEAVRGQGFAVLSTGLMTLQGLGPALFGALGEWTGPAVAIACAGIATAATALLMRTDREAEPHRRDRDADALPGEVGSVTGA
jgi:predicted MFS family arabinose efflux permease